MTNLFLSGDVLDAVDINPLRAWKTADETLNNTAALQNDDEIVIALEANATYTFVHDWSYNTGATPDLKAQFTLPAGATMVYQTQASISTHSATGLTQATVVLYDGDGVDTSVRSWGYIITAGTAGNLRHTWAQNTANASNTTIYKGAVFAATRVL